MHLFLVFILNIQACIMPNFESLPSTVPNFALHSKAYAIKGLVIYYRHSGMNGTRVERMSAMARPSSVFLIMAVHVAILISTSCGSISSEHSRKHVAFFIFGDSFLDAGNNNYINTTTLDQANFWPYGETYFRFPTGRFSDGRLISDFIAEHAKLPLIPPFLQPAGNPHYFNGVNFASAGAGALAETFQGAVIDLKTQLSYYKQVMTWLRSKLGNVGAKMMLSRAVYLFSIGTNDYMSLFLTNSTVLDTFSKSEYVGIVIGNLTTIIKDIYSRGGRKFGFINLPPVGCLPGIRTINPDNNGNCLEEASSLAKLHNQALSKLLQKLEKHLKGFKYSIFNLNISLRQRMNHPSKYGQAELPSPYIIGREQCNSKASPCSKTIQ
ncbi:GDSL esterase/lipase 5-like isoform X2 [Juglans microcarpa x Juglans regia]|uniref:GDSL esterase/lipase 5-like isoform X2 n=1 Tax=Juglans microcarpa x Juglans regia TaxID=2249226 RepID=UPI001B7E8366|nr:GDSL esterase/lipase 5-like isoform X2 [Juglans microcarpa x Juglans regia]